MMTLPQTGGEFQPLAEINVTPFVDVMLVLLIVFMVAAPLMMSGVELQLPKSSTAPLEKPRKPVIVSITADGTLHLGEEPWPTATCRKTGGNPEERRWHVCVATARAAAAWKRYQPSTGPVSADVNRESMPDMAVQAYRIAMAFRREVLHSPRRPGAIVLARRGVATAGGETSRAHTGAYIAAVGWRAAAHRQPSRGGAATDTIEPLRTNRRGQWLTQRRSSKPPEPVEAIPPPADNATVVPSRNDFGGPPPPAAAREGAETTRQRPAAPEVERRTTPNLRQRSRLLKPPRRRPIQPTPVPQPSRPAAPPPRQPCLRA
jgi:hypothetical protein